MKDLALLHGGKVCLVGALPSPSTHIVKDAQVCTSQKGEVMWITEDCHRCALRSWRPKYFCCARVLRQVHALTQEMKARGERVVSLCVGEPDFEPPTSVIEATATAAREVCAYLS